MRKRLRRIAGIGIALCVVTLAFALTDWLLMPPPGPTEANYHRITVGMRLEEVERLLGGPATSVGAETVRTLRGLPDPEAERTRFWCADGVTICITFSNELVVEEGWFSAPGGEGRFRWLTLSRRSERDPLEYLRSLFDF